MPTTLNKLSMEWVFYSHTYVEYVPHPYIKRKSKHRSVQTINEKIWRNINTLAKDHKQLNMATFQTTIYYHCDKSTTRMFEYVLVFFFSRHQSNERKVVYRLMFEEQYRNNYFWLGVIKQFNPIGTIQALRHYTRVSWKECWIIATNTPGFSILFPPPDSPHSN